MPVSTQWPLIRMAASRLVLRDRPPGAGVRRLLSVSVAVVGLGVVLLLAGVHHLVVVAAVGIGGMLALAALCLRLLLPAMAVSVVGIALSCASLMTALSVTAGFSIEITQAMARLNGHVLLTKYGLDFFEYEDIADRWLADPRITAASPFAYSMVAAVNVGPEAPEGGAPTGSGVEPAVVVGKGLDPVRAADLDGLANVLQRGDLGALRAAGPHRPGVVLGVGLAKRLRLSVGDRMRLVVPTEIDGSSGANAGPPRHAEFEVLDLLATGNSEYDRNLVLLHITAAQALFFREGRVTGIEFELSDPELADDVADEMAEGLGEVYRLSTWRETNGHLLVGLQQIRITLSLVLGLMVMMGATSLVASLLLLVRRKRHGIAVMMAVGGDSSLIFWVFEAIGVLAGLLGAALGIGLGALYCLVIDTYRYPLVGDVYPIDHLPVVVRAVDVLGPAAVAVVLCALASGPVAVMATRIGVLETLRK